MPEPNLDGSNNNSIGQNKKQKPRENGGKYGYDDYPNSQTEIHDVVDCKSGDPCLAR